MLFIVHIKRILPANSQDIRLYTSISVFIFLLPLCKYHTRLIGEGRRHFLRDNNIIEENVRCCQ